MTHYLKRLTDGRDWGGYLCLANFDAVVARVRSMIGDGQPYTWVSTNELYGLRPEVRVGMVASKVHTGDHPATAHMWVEDTYGSWGISTTAATELEARDGDKFNYVYLHFTADRYGEKLTIEQFAPAGNSLCWVIALPEAEATS